LVSGEQLRDVTPIAPRQVEAKHATATLQEGPSIWFIPLFEFFNHPKRGRIKLPIPGYSVRAQRVIVRAG